MRYHAAKFKESLYLIALAACMGLAGTAHGFPTDDAFPLPQEEPGTFVHEHPKSTVPRGQYPSLNPNLNSRINEAHPFPDYMKRFIGEHRVPRYYYELIQLPPRNQVQSRIFNPALFKRLRRIGVVDFENKLPDPRQDPDAGKLLANQVANELESVPEFNVIPPKKMVDEFHLKITQRGKVPPGKAPSGDTSKTPEDGEKTKTGYDLPYAGDKMDAVLIGAVTRFSNEYEDRRGKKQESLSASVEFGAFLISTETGEVIWAARFVGSQQPTLTNLLKGKVRWMSRQELSQEAVKKVLQVFKESRKQIKQ